MLYQAKELIVNNKEYPEFTGIICFANTIIQFFLPYSENNRKSHQNKNGLHLIIFPAFAHDGIINENQKTTITHMNLTQTEIYKHDEKFTFKARK